MLTYSFFLEKYGQFQNSHSTYFLYVPTKRESCVCANTYYLKSYSYTNLFGELILGRYHKRRNLDIANSMKFYCARERDVVVFFDFDPESCCVEKYSFVIG